MAYADYLAAQQAASQGTSAPPGPNATPNTNVGTGQRGAPMPLPDVSVGQPTANQLAPGPLTGSQALDDWITLAGQQSSVGLADAFAARNGVSLTQLRAMSQAARDRLGPVAAGSADIAGEFASPLAYLNRLPFVGPELQGAAQEGVKSYMQGNDATTALEDAARGAAAGLGGSAAANLFLRPRVLAELGAQGLERGLGMGLGYLSGGTLEHGMMGSLIGGEMMKPAGNAIREAGKTVGQWTGDWRPARTALQNLILGVQSSLRQAGGPPGQ